MAEPHRWGLEQLISLLGLEGREELSPSKCQVRIDMDDGKAYTLKELLAKYVDTGIYTSEEVRDYWFQDMHPTNQEDLPQEEPEHEQVPSLAKCTPDMELAALLEEHVSSILAEGRELRERLRRAEEDEKQFYFEKQGLELLFGGSSCNDIVRFNANGRVMATTRATL